MKFLRRYLDEKERRSRTSQKSSGVLSSGGDRTMEAQVRQGGEPATGTLRPALVSVLLELSPRVAEAAEKRDDEEHDEQNPKPGHLLAPQFEESSR